MRLFVVHGSFRVKDFKQQRRLRQRKSHLKIGSLKKRTSGKGNAKNK